MSETLTWNFTGNDRLTDLLEKLSVTLSNVDRKLSDFGKTSTKVKTETEELGRKVKGVGDTAEKTGDKVKRAFAGIDAEIAATAVELKALREEFARTGDVDLFAKIADKKSYKTKLEGVAKDLAKDAQQALDEAAKAVVSQGGGLFSRIQGLATAAGETLAMPGVGEVGIGVGAALAVPALAGAGGALTGLAGLGAVGAGVAGAVAGDPKEFSAEWTKQIEHISREWQDASKPFIGPALEALRGIGPMVDSWHIDTMFAVAAGYVKPLVAGIEGFATEIMSGVDALVVNAGPVIDTLSAVLPQVGAEIADGLKAVGENAQGGAQALGDLLQLAGGLVDAILQIVAAAELLYVGFKTVDAEVANFIRDNQLLLGVLTFGLSEIALKMSDAFNSDEAQHFGEVLPGVADDIDKVGQAAGTTKDQLKELSDAFDQALGKNLDVQHATIAYEKALDDLAASIEKNGHSLDIHTEKGRANRDAILSIVEAAEKQREATIAETNNVPAATAAYQQQIETLRANLKQMGYNTAQIDELTAAALRVPKTIPIDVELSGAKAAGAAIGALIASAGGKVAGGKTHRALGGAVMPGGIYEVNEQGVETFQPNSPGTIVPAGAGGGDPDILGVVVVRHETPSGEVIRTELLTLKRRRGLAGLGLG